MRLSYRLRRVCGSAYGGGNLLFVPGGEGGGETLLAARSNRVTRLALGGSNSCDTLPFEARSDLSRLAATADGQLLLAVDGDGRGQLVSGARGAVLHRINFKGRVRDAAFSPDGKFLAVAVGRKVRVFLTPRTRRRVTNPLTLHRVFAAHHDDVLSLDWSTDSAKLITGGRDMTGRVWTVPPAEVDVGAADDSEDSEDDGVGASSDGSSDGSGSSDDDSDSSDGGAADEEVQDPRAAGGKRRRRPSTAVPTAPPRLRPMTLSGHQDRVVGTFLSADGMGAYTVAADCVVMVWACDPEDGKWRMKRKHFLWKDAASGGNDGGGDLTAGAAAEQAAGEADADADRALGAAGGAAASALRAARVRCAAHHKKANLLVLGFSTGLFGLYEMPTCAPLQQLSVSRADVGAITISSTGEWIALGAANFGQLLVWEWQSETYVVKQQGHAYGAEAAAISPDGRVVASGGEDGKLKLWSAATGLCYATFAEHTAPVTGVCFNSKSRVVLSASLDGTCRAYDLLRYRPFRTMQTPEETPTQLGCVATDESGEIVCGGGMDPFSVYVWNLQTGSLLDVMEGHTGPVVAMAFSNHRPILATASWDKTVRLWNVYKAEAIETLTHQADVLDVAFRPDGQELCAACLNGTLSVWDADGGKLIGVVDGRRDVAGGRGLGDLTPAGTSAARKHFSSVAYSADGSCVMAAGRSRYVCAYEVKGRLLVKKWQVSSNRSMDGAVDMLNSREMTDAGVAQGLLPNSDDSDSEGEGRADPALLGLPGAKRGALGTAARREIRVSALAFAATGREFVAATTDGLQVYALDDDAVFEPLDLTEDVTPAAVALALREGDWSHALRMALALGEHGVAAQALGAVPHGDVPLVAASVPRALLLPLLELLAKQAAASTHLEHHLKWVLAAVQAHGPHLQRRPARYRAALRELQRTLLDQGRGVQTMLDENEHMLGFLGAGSV